MTYALRIMSQSVGQQNTQHIQNNYYWVYILVALVLIIIGTPLIICLVKNTCFKSEEKEDFQNKKVINENINEECNNDNLKHKTIESNFLNQNEQQKKNHDKLQRNYVPSSMYNFEASKKIEKIYQKSLKNYQIYNNNSQKKYQYYNDRNNLGTVTDHNKNTQKIYNPLSYNKMPQVQKNQNKIEQPPKTTLIKSQKTDQGSQNYIQNLNQIKNNTSQRKEREILSLGLPNLGQTCYLNSVIQCIYSMKEFRQYLTQMKEKKRFIISLIAEVLQSIKLRQSCQQKEIKIRNLIERLQKFTKNQIKYYDQNDVYLILSQIISLIIREDNKVLKFIEFDYQIKCKCQKSQKYPNQTNICLTNFTQCDDCLNGQQVILNKTSKYMIVLGRQQERDDKKYEQNLSFKINKRDSSLKSIKYKIVSIIKHYGTKTFGHYICQRKQDEKWYRLNDNQTVQLKNKSDFTFDLAVYEAFEQF